MSSNTEIDTEKLANYLALHIGGFSGPISLEKFAGGQSNPTFKLTSADGTYVLRRQPMGKLLESAHAVDREYQVIKALANTDVPVAKAYHLCQDTKVIGSMFYIMEYCDGNIYWDAALKQVQSSEQRSAMYDAMNKTLVALHRVDIDEVGLADYGKAGNYFERQLARWSSQYRASELGRIKEMDLLIEWLQNNLPQDDGKVSLVHGDFRLDNMIFAKDKSQIIAVLDWELSTLGHPYADWPTSVCS